MIIKSIGDRMKEYERASVGGSLLPFLPVIARLDGKAFHSFTKGLKRPYDETFSNMMVETTEYLVRSSNALIGYCQSDEISLLFYSGSLEGDIYFGAKKFKMVSILAAEATLEFNILCRERLPEKSKMRPMFDCRVFQVPTKEEAQLAFAWRWKDAYKNSIGMMAQSVFSHQELHKKHTGQKLKMITDAGLNWDDNLDHFKCGTFVKRTKSKQPFSPEEIESLPPQHDYFKNKDLIVERNVFSRFSSTKPLSTKLLFGEE